MKVLVPVKRVIDYNVKVRVKADGSGVDLANVKMSMNPFDEIAVEEAIRLKEKDVATEVVVVSIGVKQAQETLRNALAMGADRAILIEATDNVHTDIEPLAVAKLLAAVVKEEAPGLVLCGKQAIDNDMNATGQMLAALLGWSQATFASEVTIEGDKAKVIPPDQEITSVTADGAYDTRKCHDAIAERGAHAVIPPRKNAKTWKAITAGAIARSEALRASKYLGLALWRRWSGYHRRSRAETKMNCVKLLGQRLMARDFERQVAEFQVRVAVLHGYTALGIPVTNVAG